MMSINIKLSLLMILFGVPKLILLKRGLLTHSQVLLKIRIMKLKTQQIIKIIEL